MLAKLDLIFINKVNLKLKCSKNVFYKKCGPRFIFLKVSNVFWLTKLTLNVQFFITVTDIKRKFAYKKLLSTVVHINALTLIWLLGGGRGRVSFCLFSELKPTKINLLLRGGQEGWKCAYVIYESSQENGIQALPENVHQILPKLREIYLYGNSLQK